MSRNIISWWTIDNGVENIMINGSLKHTLKPVKTIRKRTQALNVELKKYAGLKCYSDYVSIKTDVLRHISDNEETDDETFARPTIASSDNIVTSSANEHDDETAIAELPHEVETADTEEVEEQIEEEQEEIEEEEAEQEEIEEEADEEEAEQEDIEEEAEQEEIEEEESKAEIKNETIDDDYDEQNYFEQEVSESPPTEIADEALQKKPQPIITCTEILKSKYTIIRAKDENDRSIVDPVDPQEEISHRLSDERTPEIEEVMQLENTSPETRRVSQLKRINLLYDSDDSDSSQEDANEVLPEWKRRKRAEEFASSQVISDPSDSDEWYASSGPAKISAVNRGKVDNYCSPASSPLHISDSDNDNNEDSTKIYVVTPKKTKIVKKSLKSQINEQETIDSNIKTPTRNETQCVNRISNVEPTEAESLQYVLRNILSSNNQEDILAATLNTSTPYAEEALPRPVELNEFIDREGLVHTGEISTIDIDEIQALDEEDIWLMEIPRYIATDRQLCGKKIVLEKKRLTIDDACYETIGRKDKFVSCILNAGRDQPQYKAVNVRLVGSIVVRQESSETNCAPLGQSSALPKKKSADIVPFPSNIKSRNPLMVLNDRDQRSKLASPSKPNNCIVESKEDEKSEDIATGIRDNESRETSKNIDSPSRVSVIAEHKTPRHAKRKSNEAKNTKTPVWHRDNFLLPAKKNKKIPKKM